MIGQMAIAIALRPGFNGFGRSVTPIFFFPETDCYIQLSPRCQKLKIFQDFSVHGISMYVKGELVL